MQKPYSPPLTRSKDGRYGLVEVVRGRTLVVGDIHGCHREFLELLECVRFSADDALVSVGDIVDRGPGSIELLAFFRNAPNAFVVLGNHERRLARVIREGPQRGAWSQLATIETIPPEDRDGWANFIESLPCVIETPHAIVTHARLDPARMLTAQDPYFTCAVGGASVTIPLAPDGVPRWFRERHWQKPVCIGHVGYDRIELVAGRLFALDTHAVRGGQLTMVSFPDARLSTIDVGVDYEAAARTTWKRTQSGRDDPSRWPLKRVLRCLAESPVEPAEDDPTRERLKALLKPILARAERLRPALTARFGDVPPPGPARGDYFQRVRNLVPTPIQRNIISRLLSDRPFGHSELARTTGDTPLAVVADALETLAVAYSQRVVELVLDRPINRIREPAHSQSALIEGNIRGTRAPRICRTHRLAPVPRAQVTQPDERLAGADPEIRSECR